MRIYSVGQRRKKPSPGRYRVRPLPQAGEVRVTVAGPFHRLSCYLGKVGHADKCNSALRTSLTTCRGDCVNGDTTVSPGYNGEFSGGRPISVRPHYWYPRLRSTCRDSSLSPVSSLFAGGVPKTLPQSGAKDSSLSALSRMVAQPVSEIIVAISMTAAML